MARHLRRSSADPIDLQAALEASGVVGTWLYDIPTGRIALSAPVARLIGFVPTEGGLALPAFVAGLHDADQDRIEGAFGVAGERGGAFEIAFRSRDGARRILLRGRIDRDPTGRPVRGCGIALDVTEEAGDPLHAQELANRMAEHAMTLRDLATRLGRPGLCAQVERLMVEIGFELARHLRTAGIGRRH